MKLLQNNVLGRNKLNCFKATKVLEGPTHILIWGSEIDFLISKMEHHFSPFTAAYWKSISTEHIFMKLLEGSRNKLDRQDCTWCCFNSLI